MLHGGNREGGPISMGYVGIMCAKAAAAPGSHSVRATPGVRQTGGCNMGAFYFRDNKNEIGLLRPPPGLRGKTLPSSGPSPVSSSPQDQPCSAPAPMSFHPPPLFPQSPALPACFPAPGWWHLAARLLLRRGLFCTSSLMFLMYRHH